MSVNIVLAIENDSDLKVNKNILGWFIRKFVAEKKGCYTARIFSAFAEVKKGQRFFTVEVERSEHNAVRSKLEAIGKNSGKILKSEAVEVDAVKKLKKYV